MVDPSSVIAAANRTAPAAPAAVGERPQRLLVLGGGGELGASVLEALLGSHRFAQVGVITTQRVAPALRGLAVVDDDAGAWHRFAPDTALIVFDRERRSNGRDEAFSRPLPDDLVRLATALRAAGARRLLVVVPHSPARLPQALLAGLATLDEAALAALGFEQLAFMRLARTEAAPRAAQAAQRLADWMLRQLHWMVPASEQPVRAASVARVVLALLLAWPRAAGATRVLPAALVWQVAQGADAQGLVAAWLAGRPLPPTITPARRW